MTTVSPILKEMCFAPTEMLTLSSESVQMRSISESAEPGTTKLPLSNPEFSSVSVRFARR